MADKHNKYVISYNIHKNISELHKNIYKGFIFSYINRIRKRGKEWHLPNEVIFYNLIYNMTGLFNDSLYNRENKEEKIIKRNFYHYFKNKRIILRDDIQRVNKNVYYDYEDYYSSDKSIFLYGFYSYVFLFYKKDYTLDVYEDIDYARNLYKEDVINTIIYYMNNLIENDDDEIEISDIFETEKIMDMIRIIGQLLESVFNDVYSKINIRYDYNTDNYLESYKEKEINEEIDEEDEYEDEDEENEDEDIDLDYYNESITTEDAVYITLTLILDKNRKDFILDIIFNVYKKYIAGEDLESYYYYLIESNIQLMRYKEKIKFMNKMTFNVDEIYTKVEVNIDYKDDKKNSVYQSEEYKKESKNFSVLDYKEFDASYNEKLRENLFKMDEIINSFKNKKIDINLKLDDIMY